MNNDEFKLLITEYEKLVFTICNQFVRDYQEAQNLTQDTFISAYKHIDSCKTGNYKPWLARIATNKCKDYLRSAYVKHVELAKSEEDENNVISIDPRPEDTFITNESVEDIKKRIYSLKEPYLKVSVLYFIEEKNFEEISNTLKRPKKTVQTQILRAKSILQKLLEEGA